MITYFYWTAIVGVVLLTVYLLGIRLGNWRGALVTALVILFVGWLAYFFYFQQLFVKRWGGVMSVTVPAGQVHIAVTWKDDNLWIENYDPATNRCIFTEYSKGNLLEGRVIIKNCNPMLPPNGGATGTTRSGRD